MVRRSISKRKIFMALFAVAVSYLGVEIYNFNKMYDRAWDVPAFQTKGPENAPITILEFIDYNCPYCHDFHPIVQEAIAQRNDIRYIARPIGPLGEESEQLVRLTLAAGLQGKFWEMHDAFLAHKARFGDAFIRTAALRAGVDAERMMEDAKSQKIDDYLQDNKRSAGVLAIRYTPSLMINKTIYVPQKGVPTAEELTRVIDRAAR